MKNKIVVICICTLLIATAAPAVGILNNPIHGKSQQLQNSRNMEWNLTYDRGEFDEIRYILQTTDGGYICCGLTEESDNYYVMILKLDTNGEEEWHVVNYDLNGTILGQTDNWIFTMHILQTNDGGFLFSGWSTILVDVEGEYIWLPAGYLWKTNATGATDWLQHYYSVEELGLDFLYCTEEISMGYAACGFRIYYDISGQIIDIRGFLMETDSDGNLQWFQSYDAGGDDDELGALCSTDDGGYILTGYTTSSLVNNGALWMVKTDGDGNKQWDKIFDGPDFEYTYVKGCYQTSDGGYLMAGNTASYGAGLVDVWVIKTDSSGNEMWNKTYGYARSDYSWSMDQTSNGEYVLGICKDMYYNLGTKTDIWIVQFNEQGDTEWNYLIEEAGTQIITCIKQTDDEGFVVSGRTNEYGTATSDGIVVKVGPFPHLDIELKGGLGIRAIITNTGLGDAIQVPYHLSVTGGILGLLNQSMNGTIDIFPEEQKTFLGFFFRLGTINITVKIGLKEKIATAVVFGPFVLNIT